MKYIFLFVSLLFTITITSAQHLKKDGTPDMRYKENKINYSTPSHDRTNSSTRYQNGYSKSNGTYVQPHYKTENNNTNIDNYSTKGNIDSYTGKVGSRAKDYSPESYHYGKGYNIKTGVQGGQYYLNTRGHKIYVPKRY